ncbi:MAG TPA: hypothetical protein DEB74_03155 [Lachnospiraceae bacterium]|nr:hypothetical protein [Lachnospiraceae bacterium]
MDKQSNVLFNTRLQELHQDLGNETWSGATRAMSGNRTVSIPVNTRTIGVPEGIYILYLEDYVHTFIKKIISNKKIVENDLQKSADYQIETNVSSNIALYGKVLEESGRYRIVISGAAILDGNKDKIQQLNNTYFPSCTYIGTANASQNKDQGLRLELTLRSTKVILDDFYIYYDQNEEMQNYLVEWNNSKQNGISKVILSPTEHDAQSRNHRNDAAHLSRIAQSYNREEAKVGFMWNVMNLLCLGFVVCVMVYGIISINNYNKMQHMQASIDYCIAFITKNSAFHNNAIETDTTQAVPTMQQTIPVGNIKPEKEMAEENNADASGEKEQTQNIVANQEASSTQDIAEQESIQEQMTITQPEQDIIIQPSVQETPTQDIVIEQSAQEQSSQENLIQEQSSQETPAQQSESTQDSVPQYYVVRKGDTLQTICYDVYGDYSRVDEICRWNNIENPDNILYGQKLLLP